MERERADVAERRRLWIERRQPLMRLEPARLVFIDETAVATNLTRLRGRALRGDRPRGTHGGAPRVVVVVGGNTEGQAAPQLAQHGSPVSLEIRGADLDKNMSPYLVDRIDADDRNRKSVSAFERSRRPDVWGSGRSPSEARFHRHQLPRTCNLEDRPDAALPSAPSELPR